tara:strand:+ start:2325 stop:2588 length:264 start_codon:yes stop_codon:yes gene_type:complete
MKFNLSLFILFIFINLIFGYNFIKLICPLKKDINFNSYLYTKTILDKKKEYIINNRKNRTKTNNFKLIHNKYDYLNFENDSITCSEN